VKTLLLLRHAKSSWDDPGLDDHDRPLNKRGRRDAPRMGRLLRDEKLLPDVVLCSTAERARETADATSEASGFSGETRFLRGLYLASPADILAALRAIEADVRTAMVVGHNTGIEELLALLTGAGEHLPTGALARISLPVKGWKELGPGVRGRLVGLWRPKDLD
jgi:phosphohistidine phosphatase